eukprot:1953665-Pleurochrysis_carterae.AAC.1
MIWAVCWRQGEGGNVCFSMPRSCRSLYCRFCLNGSLHLLYVPASFSPCSARAPQPRRDVRAVSDRSSRLRRRVPPPWRAG